MGKSIISLALFFNKSKFIWEIISNNNSFNLRTPDSQVKLFIKKWIASSFI